ncbi:HdeD family acid-resistance protein [Demequina sp.]|uniref:HdeD family acid-resistance protein n=1 Tax=Demequina sp. TaxID=2050685 RepID=UPI0025D7593E|nr:DUF308 domain-containing protein [Demequina sp.]
MEATRTLGFDLDEREMTRSAISAIRIVFGVLGALALAIGIALLVWPGRTLVVGAALVGIYFAIAGVVRIAVGIFGSALSGGLRTLTIIFGLFMLLAGVVLLRNLEASTAILLVIMAIAIGIGWIIDGIMALVESGKAASRGWAITYGIIGIVAGVFVISAPGVSAAFFVLLNAIVFVILGVVGLVRAFTFGRGVVEA